MNSKFKLRNYLQKSTVLINAKTCFVALVYIIHSPSATVISLPHSVSKLLSTSCEGIYQSMCAFIEQMVNLNRSKKG